MTKKQIATVVLQLLLLLRENPSWTYKKAIDKAKEMLKDDKEIYKMEKVN